MTAYVREGGGAKLSPDLQPRSRSYDRAEKFADLCVHAVGATSAAVGAAILLAYAARRGWTTLAPATAYASALVFAFVASAAYNFAYDTRLRAALRRLDHSAIFVMIAGTYTPFITLLAHGPLRLWATAGIWAIAAVGVALKFFAPPLFERISVALYLAFGWASLALAPQLSASLSQWSFALLAAGGALYSIGVCFHLREHMRFHNAVWHLFVLAAASCHFASVFVTIARA